MFSMLKSLGNKALSTFTSQKIKITTPFDQNLQQKLQQISNQILKSQSVQQQFKIYIQLQSLDGSNFNNCLRQIYENSNLSTQTLIVIIKFYTFLLTNCKNQLVVCKLVSEPLVIELTKIVLELENKEEKRQSEKSNNNNKVILFEQKQLLIEEDQNQNMSKNEYQKQQNKTYEVQEMIQMQDYQSTNKDNTIISNNKRQSQTEDSININIKKNQQAIETNPNAPQINSITKQQPQISSQIQSLQYTNYIDWQQVNSYKVALIRSYINCINPETIKYMIINNQIPIFINCLAGYKHYLNDGVQGTCISNCILMILTKVNHNDQVCDIIFGERNKVGNKYKKDQGILIDIEGEMNSASSKSAFTNSSTSQTMKKSISRQKSIKLHDFIKQIIQKIGSQINKVFNQIITKSKSTNSSPNNQSPQNNQNQQNQQFLRSILQNFNTNSSLQISMQFIQSNILFCIDLLNSINNYNYVTKIKQNIGETIQKVLINKIILFYYTKNLIHTNNGKNYQNMTLGQSDKIIKQFYQKPINTAQGKPSFQLILLRLIRFVLNLSILSQREQKSIKFLNHNAINLLDNILFINSCIFDKSQAQSLSKNQVQLKSEENIQKSNEVQQIQQKLNQNQSQLSQRQNRQNQQVIQQNIQGQKDSDPILNDKNQLNQQQKPNSPTQTKTISTFIRPFLTYICQYSLIILKQTISPHSRLASRKRLQNSPQIIQLKQQILQRLFTLLQQIINHNQLSQGMCYKSIRNLLLSIFYLTIKQDKCSLSLSSQNGSNSNNIISSQTKNLGLILKFKYNILLLHKKYCQIFKSTFVDNKNWPYIVNNYQTLMRSIPDTILSAQQTDKYCQYHNNNTYYQQDAIRNKILISQAVRNYRYMIIHETKLQSRLIRLENIYHRHFLSPGWNHHPGQTVYFASKQEYKIICVGLLHSNSMTKLPIQVIQDFECLILGHKVASTDKKQTGYRIIANIRYKKINSFVPENKHLIRMKLIGIQELVLEFSNTKTLTTFKQYLNQNRNKTRQKQLKFINYYLNMYLKDSQRLIQQIWEQDIFDGNLDSPVLSNKNKNISSNSSQSKLSVNNEDNKDKDQSKYNLSNQFGLSPLKINDLKLQNSENQQKLKMNLFPTYQQNITQENSIQNQVQKLNNQKKLSYDNIQCLPFDSINNDRIQQEELQKKSNKK